MKISGSGKLSEGKIDDSLVTSGSARIDGDFECNGFRSSGSFRGSGNLTVHGDFRSSGSFRIHGSLKGDGNGRTSGSASVDGKISIDGYFRSSGSLRVGGKIELLILNCYVLTYVNSTITSIRKIYAERTRLGELPTSI